MNREELDELLQSEHMKQRADKTWKTLVLDVLTPEFKKNDDRIEELKKLLLHIKEHWISADHFHGSPSDNKLIELTED